LPETILRLVVLYADISGSTRIYEQYGDTIARTDIATCLGLLSDVAGVHGGKTVKTIGDEIMCVFKNPVGAACAAREMQKALSEVGTQGRFQSEPLHVKIGWHYGSAGFRQDDVIGEAPLFAQQIIRLAKRDEILTTGKSLAALPEEYKHGANFIDRIEAEDGSGQIDVYSLSWDEDAGEVTQVRSQPAQTGPLSHRALLLDYAGNQLQMDSNRTHCTIGRGDDNDLVVEGEFTSRNHAVIFYRHGRFHLKDMSTNGTVLIQADGHLSRLHRGEGMLSGKGIICFGGEPDIDPEALVHFQCVEG